MEALTEMERTVLARLAENPFAAQQDIAEALGIPRPTLAMHITQLTRKGYILGRAYVLAKGDRIVCIGGANIETRLMPVGNLVNKTSNPVETIQTFGGVARNVAEHAVRQGLDVSLISMVGDDYYGRSIITHLNGLGVDTSNVVVRADSRTATFTAIIQDREMSIGFSDMEIFDTLTTESVERMLQQIASATWVLADCNLPGPILKSLIDRRRNSKFDLAIDGVSPKKALRLPAELGGVDALFLRQAEAAAYIGDDVPPETLCSELVARGARMAVVTSPDFSVYAAATEEQFSLPSHNRNFADFGGENDTLVSVALCALMRGSDFRAALSAGMSAAAAARDDHTLANA